MSVDSNQASQPVYFNCHMCGECCSSWNIPIETEKAQRLLEKPWVQARLAETNRQLTPMTPETYRIPLTDENVCVFLAEDRRCLVEAHEGLSLKPHECQRFPFAKVRLPDGSEWHETSAACKSISEKLLLAFQPIQPKPVKQFATHPKDEAGKASEWKLLDAALDATQAEEEYWDLAVRLPKRIPVRYFQSLSMEQYRIYQRQLRQIFMIPALHPEAALFQAHQFLSLLGCGQENHWSEHSVPKTRRLAPGLAGLLRLYFLRKPYRTWSWISLLLGRTYADPRIFGMPVALREQAKLAWNDDLNLHLNAFLFNLLQRKRMIALGSSLSAHLAMAGIACLLVQWYAKTLAWLRNSPEISENDLASGIRLVERYYTGHQPRFLAFFTARWVPEMLSGLMFGWSVFRSALNVKKTT